MGRENPIDSLRLRPSWCVSRLISSSYRRNHVYSGGQECDQDDSHRYVGLRSDPVEAGLVESLARPGGNVTGITTLSQRVRRETARASQRSDHQSCPCRRSLRAGIRLSQIEVKEILPVAARSLRLTIQPWEVRGVDDFDRVFVTMGKQRSDGLYVTHGPADEYQPKTDRGLCLKKPVAVGVRHQRKL